VIEQIAASVVAQLDERQASFARRATRLAEPPPAA
jgi:hypothetical protein